MKSSLYLLLFVIAFAACDNPKNEIIEEAQANVENIESEPIEAASEAVTKVYKNVPDKENFELNENFHVMALSGLRMRATPELKGKTILTIPYDAAVEQVDNGDYGILEVEEIKDFVVKGNWMKVRYEGKEGYVFNGYLTQFPMPNGSDYLKKEGYVFDGFLTKFPLPEVLINGDYDYKKYESSFDYYFRTKVGSASEKYNIEKYRDCEPVSENDCICGYTQDFGSIVFSKSSCSESSMDELIKIKNISLTEAYFIIKAMDLNNVTSTDPNYQASEDVNYYKEEDSIYFEAEGAGCYSTLKGVSEDEIEIEISCGC